MNQDNCGCSVSVGAFANRTNGIDPTNLSLYKLCATIRTAGLTDKSSQGRIQWRFFVPYHSVLGLEVPAILTTNFQVYSFTLNAGIIDCASDSWSEFTNEFDQINALQIGVVADQWLNQYGADASNAF